MDSRSSPDIFVYSKQSASPFDTHHAGLRGDFDRDLDHHGGTDFGRIGGSLMGPGHFNRNEHGGPGSMMPRVDPFGP